MILSADWHLDDNPANEYRWEIFKTLRSRDYTDERIIILGDMVDRKDRHKSEFVNRVIRELCGMRDNNNCDIDILRGNHDTAVSGPSYFEYLKYIPHINYISEPLAADRKLYLPASTNPTEEWQGIDFSLYKVIFMHQTVRDSNLGNIIAEGDKYMLPPFPHGVKVYSGDVHPPQEAHGVIYIGAPHPVDFGDTHRCRLLRMYDDDMKHNAQDIPLNPIRKHMLDVSSLEELQAIKTRRGDQAYVRFVIDRARVAEWPAERDAVRAWAARAGVTLAAVEPKAEMPEPDSEAAVLGLEADHEAILTAFAEAEGIEEALLEMGREILHNVRQ